MTNFADRRLYLCTPLRDDLLAFVQDCVTGGVDVVQLRDKSGDRHAITAAAVELAALCRDFDVPFIVNDEPTIAAVVGADGVHVGQDDICVARCREILGPDAIVGLSTHADDEFDRALAEAATYLSAGPLVATPTKPGREGTGPDYPVRATRRADRPVFITGGVTADNVGGLVTAGLRHFVVVRALTEAAHPLRAARALRTALDDALSAVTI